MIRKLRAIAAVAATALALNAYAGVDQFLLLPGIEGESPDEIYKDSIDVLAWSWGVSQPLAGGGANTANFQDVSATKYVDSSSVELYRHVGTGDMLDYAVLKNRKSGNAPFISDELVMYEVLITSASTGGSRGEDRLTENITLNFGSFCLKHTKDINSPTMEFCWNIAVGEPCTAAQLEPLMEFPMALSLPMDKLLRMNPVCRKT